METANPATFQILGFSIPVFSFRAPEAKYSTINIQLNPAGIYTTLNGEYQLVVVFIANAVNPEDQEDQQTYIEATLKATYTIEGKPTHDKIPDFFYQNCLAIIFPYLRGFVSNLTLQAGLPLLILPLLNLTHLSSTLKENTKVFE
jgi:preprotein translocase subunit SecB